MQIHSFGVLKGQKYLQFEIKSCTKVNRSQVEILDNTTLAENLMMQRFIYQWIWRFSSYRYSIDFIIIEMTGLNFSYSVNNTVSVPVFHKFAYCQSKISFYFPVIIIGMHSKLHRSWPELQRQAGIQRAGAVVEGLGGNSCRWGHPGKQLLPPSPLPHSLSLSLTSHMHTRSCYAQLIGQMYVYYVFVSLTGNENQSCELQHQNLRIGSFPLKAKYKQINTHT